MVKKIQIFFILLIMSNNLPNFIIIGAMKAATGNVFEAAIDSAFKRSPDVETATWDVYAGSRTSEGVRKLFGINSKIFLLAN